MDFEGFRSFFERHLEDPGLAFAFAPPAAGHLDFAFASPSASRPPKLRDALFGGQKVRALEAPHHGRVTIRLVEGRGARSAVWTPPALERLSMVGHRQLGRHEASAERVAAS